MALTPQQRRRMRFNQLLMMQMSMAAYASTKAQDLSAAAELLATWADSNGGLAFDFTDITSTQPFGSGKIIDGATPANSWSTSPTVTNFDKLTWTGASLRMCYGSDGVLRYAPHNLMVRSQEFDNASWTKTSVAVSANATTAPDGTTTADLVYPSSSGSDRRITQGVTVNNGMAYENRIYAKYAGIRWVRVSSSSASSSLDEAWFDVQNGVAGTYGANISSTSIVASGDGWYRLTVTEITNKAFGDAIFISLVDADGGTSVTANGTDGVYLWGAQLQALPVHSTDYIATTSSAVYKPRIDYDPSTLAVRGLLVEEARTNLALYSDDMNNAAWTLDGVTRTTGVSGPTGATTATTLTDTAANVTHRIYDLNNNTTAVAHTLSIYAKAGTLSWFQLDLYDGTDTQYANFNVSSGVTGAVGSGVTSTIQDVGGGWYRCTATRTMAAVATANWQVCLLNSDTASATPTYLGTGSGTMSFFGIQMEAGAFATSYIPTTSASVTRAADAVSIATSLFNYLGTTQTLYGSFITDGEAAASRGCNYIDIGNSEASRAFILDVSGNTRVDIKDAASSTIASMTPAAATAPLTTFKIAVAMTASDMATVKNGGTPATDVTGTPGGTGTSLRIGDDYTGGSKINGHVRQIMHLPRRMSNADLQTLTT